MQGNYQSELDLCRLFLLEDQRNFHCWCYRRLVVQIGDIQPKDEFDFSTEKIDENFSNYSAYHHRSVYIQKLGIRSKDVIETEFSIIENAIYTEPDDQSSWWYHQFLLTWISQQHQNNGDEKLSEADWSSWYQSILEKQIKVMEALLEVEPSSKWAMCSLTMMLGLILNLFCEENPVIVPDSGVHSTVDLLSERRQTLLTILCEVDPFHANRYKYLRRKKYAICTSVNVL